MFDLISQNSTSSKQAADAKVNAARDALLEKVKKANEIKALGNTNALLINKQIKLLLAPLKCKGDASIPSRKVYMLKRLTE